MGTYSSDAIDNRCVAGVSIQEVGLVINLRKVRKLNLSVLTGEL